MQPDEPNELLLKELGLINWDIIKEDILLLKKELENLIAKDNSINDKRIEIDFLIRAIVHDIQNDKDISTDEVYQRVLNIKDKIRG